VTAPASPSGAATLRVVVVGDLMVDVLAVMSAPLAHGSDTPAQVSTHGGGSGANVACWLAAAGVHATYVGRVGNDPLGREALDDMAAAGVEVEAGLADRATGSCVVLVEPGGQRSMLPDTGANAMLRPEHLPARAFRPGTHLHLSGYTLLHPGSHDAAMAALAMAADAAMTVSVDSSSTALLEAFGPAEFVRCTQGPALLLANADEAAVLSGESNPAAAAAALASSYAEVVVKLGAAGARWQGGFISASAPAERGVDVIDTTGAGDAFAAGFLTSWLLHPEPESALAAGNALAARAVARPGARPAPLG
jgi:sugar/nucleoside kinase (ribokinase family)